MLATASLFAVWLDPSEPAKHAGVAYGLLVAYLVAAGIVALEVWRAGVPFPGQGLATHIFDLAFFSLFIYFTYGPSSPFTAYFVFSLVCATLRWGWRGTLWTAVAALTTFIGLGVYFAEVLRDPAFQLNPFIIRAAYLAVIAALLGYLGAYERQARREISLLSGWPRVEPASTNELAHELLEYAARVANAPRAAMAWVERDEPWLSLAVSGPGGLTSTRHPPESFQPLVSPEIEIGSFLCTQLDGSNPVVLRRSEQGLTRWYGAPLNAELVQRLQVQAVLAVPLRGEAVSGWLWLLDKRRMTADDLSLAQIVGDVVASRLEHHFLLQELSETAANTERVRLARDLHDGVLQSFTGVALRLEAIRRQLESEPTIARVQLEEVQRLIALEQRDLRHFIHELQPAPRGADEGPDVRERLEQLGSRVEREWNMRVDLAAQAPQQPVGDALSREIYMIVREALVNAARHGHATAARVELTPETDARLAITVSDNGEGFPFEGSFDQTELAARGIGPRTLRERVAALHGQLRLVSSARGARLEISLPLAAAET